MDVTFECDLQFTFRRNMSKKILEMFSERHIKTTSQADQKTWKTFKTFLERFITEFAAMVKWIDKQDNLRPVYFNDDPEFEALRMTMWDLDRLLKSNEFCQLFSRRCNTSGIFRDDLEAFYFDFLCMRMLHPMRVRPWRIRRIRSKLCLRKREELRRSIQYIKTFRAIRDLFLFCLSSIYGGASLSWQFATQYLFPGTREPWNLSNRLCQEFVHLNFDEKCYMSAFLICDWDYPLQDSPDLKSATIDFVLNHMIFSTTRLDNSIRQKAVVNMTLFPPELIITWFSESILESDTSRRQLIIDYFREYSKEALFKQFPIMMYLLCSLLLACLRRQRRHETALPALSQNLLQNPELIHLLCHIQGYNKHLSQEQLEFLESQHKNLTRNHLDLRYAMEISPGRADQIILVYSVCLSLHRRNGLEGKFKSLLPLDLLKHVFAPMLGYLGINHEVL